MLARCKKSGGQAREGRGGRLGLDALLWCGGSPSTTDITLENEKHELMSSVFLLLAPAYPPGRSLLAAVGMHAMQKNGMTLHSFVDRQQRTKH
jgi:hypothetical protein